MNNPKKLRILLLCLSIIISKFDSAFSSLVKGTLVATPGGLVPVEKLKVGDKVFSCNLDETEPGKKMITVAITGIDKHMTDSVFTMCMGKDRFVMTSPQQIFFTLNATPGQTFDISAIDFIKAQHITTKHMLIDVNMVCFPITHKGKLELYTKKTRGISIEVYALEVEEPHVFFISDSSYSPVYEYYSPKNAPWVKLPTKVVGFKPKDPKCTKNHCLILTHNGLPALGLGVSLAFGSTPASISFAEATAAIGGLSLSAGPAGLAVGCVTGLGLLGYHFFYKTRDRAQNYFYLERADKNSGPGGQDPNDPKKKLDDRITNTITKVEFFRQLKDQYEYWKDGIYRLKDRAMGLLDGKAYYLQWDNLHNDLEVYSKTKNHLGSLDPKTLNLYKGPVYGRNFPGR